MHLSVKEIINSNAYDRQADLWAKGALLIAFLVAAYVGIFTPITLGWHWLWVIPSLLIGISLLWAMPTMLIQVWLASLASKHLFSESKGINKGKLILLLKNMWGILIIPIEIWIVYNFLNWVGSL